MIDFNARGFEMHAQRVRLRSADDNLHPWLSGKPAGQLHERATGTEADPTHVGNEQDAQRSPIT